jgi:hypothetical protein
MSKIIDIIDRLLLIYIKWAVQREQLKAQRNRDELLKNPADWYAGHFDGVSNSSDTEKADQAKTSDSKTN